MLLGDKELIIKTVLLPKIRRQLQLRIPESILEDSDNITVDAIINYMVEEVIFKFEIDLWTEKIDSHLVKYPANWWEAFKERWLSWNWTVKYVEYYVNLHRLYPKLETNRLKGEEDVLQFKIIGGV